MIPKRFILLGLLFIFLAGCGGHTKEELFTKGMAEAKKANPNGAIVFFRNALEKDNNFSEARYQLAKAYMSAGKYELAEKEFHKVLLQAPLRDEVKLELAKLYIADGKPDAAAQQLNEYVLKHGETPEALELTGLVYAAKGKPNDAESCLLKSLKAGPSRTSVKLELATVYELRGKEDEVRRLINEVLSVEPYNTRAYYLLAQLELSSGNSDKALGIYYRISKIDKSDVIALYKSGLLYVEKKDLDKAGQMAAYILRKFPASSESGRLKGIIDYCKADYTDAIPELQRSIQVSPSAEAYYYLGLSYYARGDFESALSQFDVIHENNPFSEQARFFTALILVKLQRVDDSITELNKLLAEDPGFAPAHNLLGSAYMAKGMYAEGMEELNKAIELDPGIADAHLKEGIFHLRNGKLKEAEADFKAEVKVAPGVLNSRLILASFYARQKDYTKAISVLTQGLCGKKSDAILYNNMAVVMYAQNKEAEGLKYLQKAEASDPAYLAASFNIAAFYIAGNQPQKALQEYRGILQKDPRNGAALLDMASLLETEGRDDDAYACYKKAEKTKKGPAYLALAVYLMKKNRYENALSVLDEATETLPKNTDVLEMKAQILASKKQFPEAISVCDDIASINPELGLRDKVNTYMMMNNAPKALERARRFIALNPNSGFGHLVLAQIYEKQNDLVRAIDEAKAAVSTESGDLQAILMLGNLYARKKDYKSAMAAYAEAVHKDSNFTPALFAQGALLEEAGKKKEAIEKYREALSKSANYVPALNNLAYLLVNGYGSPQEGLRLAFQADRLEPGNPGVMDTLGYALLRNGRGAEALKLLEKAVALSPNSPTVEYHLALAFREAGMRGQSIMALRRSLSLGDFPDAANARKLIGQV